MLVYQRVYPFVDMWCPLVIWPEAVEATAHSPRWFNELKNRDDIQFAIFDD